jgi:hypothetical protein
MFKMDKGGVMPPSKGGSAPQNTAVGSGSRPMGGKVGIETSAPANPHQLDRFDKGGKWLR